MASSFQDLQDRIERLEQAVGDIRDRLRNCVQVADRPQDALALARSIAETIAKRTVENIGIKPPAMLEACLRELEKPEVMSRGLVPSEIITILHMVRVMGNKAAHDDMRIQPSEADVSLVLQSILRVVDWYFSAFERGPRLERVFGPERGAPRTATVDGRRRSVYEELWQRIEEIHLKIRTEELEGETFSALLRGMNTYIFQNSAVLDDAIHQRANTYLLSLMDVRRQLAEAGNENASRAFADTRPIPSEAIEKASKLSGLLDKTDAIRADLLGRVRPVLDASVQPATRKKVWWKFW